MLAYARFGGPAAAYARQLKVATRGKVEWTKGSVGVICPLR